MLHILLRVIEARLRQRSGCARGRLGAVSFVQRFGSALNAHVHFHCCVIDGVFAVGEDGQVHFAEAAALTPEDLAAVQQQVRARVLRWFARAGISTPPMRATWPAGTTAGASRWMPRCASKAADRAGLERLLRYCARPPFALERLEQLADDQLVYRFPRPQPDGRTELRLTPLELIERLAALIPPPRLHRHRYHGAGTQLAAARAGHRTGSPAATAHAQRPPSHAPRARRRAISGRAAGAHLRDFAAALCAVRGRVRIIAFVIDAPAVNDPGAHPARPEAADAHRLPHRRAGHALPGRSPVGSRTHALAGGGLRLSHCVGATRRAKSTEPANRPQPSGRPPQPGCVNAHGFSLHAAVRCGAHQRKELERLCRYITRPAIANQRLKRNPAGQVVLQLKSPWRDGTTHIVMSPLELMQRLAALVPRPRLHLIRFHGVLAPHANLRAQIVPSEPVNAHEACDSTRPHLPWRRRA